EADAAAIARIGPVRPWRARIPMGRPRRAGIPVRRAIPAVIVIPAATAAARQVIGRNPAIGAALFDIAPAAPAPLYVDALAAAQRIDDAIAGARAGADIDIVGGVGGRGKSGGGRRQKRQNREATCHEILAQ